MARQVDPSIMAGFFIEARGYLPRIAQGLDAHQAEPSSRQALAEVYRLLHSIRGTAAMLGLEAVSETAGQAEKRVDEALQGRRPLDIHAREHLRAKLRQVEERLAAAAVEGPVGEGVESTEVRKSVVSVPADPAPIFEDPELAATVAEEFRGYLDQIGSRLRALRDDRGRTELLSELWRPVHTIKGTAGIVGLGEVSQIAHRMEDLLTQLGEGGRSLDDASLGQLFAASDHLAQLIEQPVGEAASGGAKTIAPLRMSGVEGIEAVRSSAPAPESVLRVRADRLDGVLRLLGDVTLQRSGFDQQVARLGELHRELQLNLRRMARIAGQLGHELDTGGLATSIAAVPTPGEAAATEFDSLEMDRYTSLNRLARQLEEATSDSAAVGSGLAGLLREVEGFQSRLGQATRDMQERLVELRTVPFATLRDRLHRTVRVTADRCGKQAVLEIVGEQVELDKDVIEEMAEPLLHLLRNAVDHGIEAPAVRLAAGKPEQGRIRIEVAYRGTEAVIRIDDDGAGLDAEGLEQRASQLGLSPASAEPASADGRLERLIFERGLSTASEVSEVSGRGVGLDVVRASVDRLRGLIEVTSQPGDGVGFIIRLPGSQSILRVLLVASRGEVLAVPLATVDRVEAIRASDLETIDGTSMVNIAGESLRALDLGSAIGLPSSEDDLASSSAILLDIADQRLALLVEQILGVREVVVRPMADLFAERLYGLSGAALTGDGQVVLTLNPGDFLGAAPTAVAAPAPRRRRTLEVLIVDDSLSIRQILSRMVERNGWRALVARDGEEALELLQRSPRPPDVAIVDLEMPRIDGFELTRTMQAHEVYRRVPIIILTTRAGDKHRAKAYDLGVVDYLVKPYREKFLLAAIRDAIGQPGEHTV